MQARDLKPPTEDDEAPDRSEMPEELDSFERAPAKEDEADDDKMKVEMTVEEFKRGKRAANRAEWIGRIYGHMEWLHLSKASRGLIWVAAAVTWWNGWIPAWGALLTGLLIIPAMLRWWFDQEMRTAYQFADGRIPYVPPDGMPDDRLPS